MLDNGKISIQQAGVLVLFCSIGDSILVLPSTVASAAGQDTWLACLLGLPAGLLIVKVMLLLAGMYPRDSYVQIIEKLLGRWVGSVLAVLVLGYTLIVTSTMIREVGDFMVSQMMTDTPMWSIYL